MLRLSIPLLTLAACGLIRAAATSQVLWKAPPVLTVEDWVWGPGGAESAPVPPYQFVKENLNGTNPKIDVRDARGKVRSVKFGGEVHSDTFAARISLATGYAAAPAYFVPSGNIEGVHGLKRAKSFVSRSGGFRKARFKLKSRHKESWSWVDNPFVDTREFGGLKILVMLLSNWDTKDSRDGEGSNTGVFEASRSSQGPAWFAVTDWGASLGRSGGFFTRERWDPRSYQAETRHFARLLPDGRIEWGFRGKHGRDITAGVGVEDVRWLLPYLSRITEQQLAAGLSASGASPWAAQQFTRSIRERIEILARVAHDSEGRNPHGQRAAIP